MTNNPNADSMAKTLEVIDTMEGEAEPQHIYVRLAVKGNKNFGKIIHFDHL